MELFKNRKKFVNVWFFSGRSIGVTLLGLYALQTAKRGQTNEYKARLFLVMTNDSPIYKEMLIGYPDIQIVYLNFKNIFNLSRILAFFLWQKNLFFYPPAFGRPPMLARMFSFLLCRLNFRSDVVGFTAHISLVDKFFYSRRLQLDLHKNIFSAVSESIRYFLPSNLEPPQFLYRYDTAYQETLPNKYIVFHPYAAHEIRTYPDSLSRKLIVYLLQKYPDYKIIISGGPGDAERMFSLIKSIEALGDRLLIIGDCGADHYNKTAQLIAKAALFIGVDTGITHLATNVGTSIVMLGNRSNPMWLPEYGSSVTILTNLDRCTCTSDKGGGCVTIVDGKQYYRCMADISWQSITSAIELRIHE